MVSFHADYISVGGNRHPAAAAWDVETGLLAYGADDGVAIWDPRARDRRGVRALLAGHAGKVNAVRWCRSPARDGGRLLLTGSVDKTIRVWERRQQRRRQPQPQAQTAAPPPAPAPAPTSPECEFVHNATLTGHEGSINCIAYDDRIGICASGAADGTVRIWRLQECAGEDGTTGGIEGCLLETIALKPRFFPLAIALQSISTSGDGDNMSVVLAVGGTRTPIQLYVARDVGATTSPHFELVASLLGHDAWVRSLQFQRDPSSSDDRDHFYLASASQDKYIRLWRVQPADQAGARGRNQAQEEQKELIGTIEKTLTSKTYTFTLSNRHSHPHQYSVTFEALLFGHEDWVYTVAWSPRLRPDAPPQLMSASADNSLVIWEQDAASGVWYAAHRMGELSVQKGSTTATGSAGGFWAGAWGPAGDEVACLGRTGSWRRWRYDPAADAWVETLGVTGHVRAVTDVEWEPEGAYLLSTSADQTTRLHAEWRRGEAVAGGQVAKEQQVSWHEFSRPQIHGYDLNCLASISPSVFVSGADEKLLRVFEETRVIAQLLHRLSGFTQEQAGQLPEAANIPVLGLSNKAFDDEIPAIEAESAATTDSQGRGRGAGHDASDAAAALTAAQVSSLLDLDHPPFEDHLAKFSLWPEHEKLYGHGYEISAVAASQQHRPPGGRRLIATACKASSLEHAVIRLYDARGWGEVRPPLAAHALTVTALAFSPDDAYLASVGRDRQWAVFRRVGGTGADGDRDGDARPSYSLFARNMKGHARMILHVCWAPVQAGAAPMFVTAGRDKAVNVWRLVEGDKKAGEGETAGDGVRVASIKTGSPVSAVACYPALVRGEVVLAVGETSGRVAIFMFRADACSSTPATATPADLQAAAVVPPALLPSKPITKLAWRPRTTTTADVLQLAVASEDTALRIYAIDGIM